MTKFWIARLLVEDLDPLMSNEIFSNTACDLERISQVNAGDVVLIYCSKTDRRSWTPVKSFFGIARILTDELIEVGFANRPLYGKRAIYYRAPALPLHKVANCLSFMKRKNYGDLFLDGLFQISREDSAFIAHHLLPAQPIRMLIE